MKESRKVAFCTTPHTGGIYSVYQRLRVFCAEHGWDVMCVYPASEIKNWNGFDRSLADDGVVELGSEGDTLIASARNFVEWVRSEQVEIVVPMSIRSCLSAVPHLPLDIGVITRCINVTPHAYRLVTAHQSRTNAVVVTSPRQRKNLQQSWHVPAEKMRLIPNSVDLQRFHSQGRTYSQADQPLRIGIVDRLEDLQKSIFMVPDILAKLDQQGFAWEMDVVGAGPDEERFKTDLCRLGQSNSIRFHGKLPLSDVAQRMREIDVLLKPSKNEGFPSSVIEAMACGAVPVVTRIAGVTDWIVNDGETGILCRMGDSSSFSAALVRLASDREKLRRMAEEASSDVATRFHSEGFGEAWCDLFEQVPSQLGEYQPRPWEEFELALPFQPRRGLRKVYGFIPRPWKEKVRMGLENLRTQVN